MTETQTRYAVTKARLELAGKVVYDGPIDQLTITDPDYYVLSDDTLALPVGYTQASADIRGTYRAMCVSRTTNGVRRMIDGCRTYLLDWSPNPGLDDPLREIESGPILPDREGDDTRYSSTLIYRTIATRTQETP